MTQGDNNNPWGGAPQGGEQPQQGGGQPQQGGWQPQQGGAQPQQGGAQPQQGGAQPQHGGGQPQQGGWPAAGQAMTPGQQPHQAPPQQQGPQQQGMQPQGAMVPGSVDNSVPAPFGGNVQMTQAQPDGGGGDKKILMTVGVMGCVLIGGGLLALSILIWALYAFVF